MRCPSHSLSEWSTETVAGIQNRKTIRLVLRKPNSGLALRLRASKGTEPGAWLVATRTAVSSSEAVLVVAAESSCSAFAGVGMADGGGNGLAELSVNEVSNSAATAEAHANCFFTTGTLHPRKNFCWADCVRNDWLAARLSSRQRFRSRSAGNDGSERRHLVHNHPLPSCGRRRSRTRADKSQMPGPIPVQQEWFVSLISQSAC